jgi:DNA-binding beta-propeller fold protein YncE
MKRKIFTFCLFVIFMFCVSLNAQESFQSSELTKVWEVKSGLDVPESAFYNPFDHTIYVSNIVGKFDEKDGIGYISKINLKGEMIQKEWVSGLNGPKGMYFTKTKLFVTDFDRIVEIEMPSGKILKEFKNSLSKDLNDVTIASNGKVYVTDSGSDCLFVVGKDSLEVFIQSKEVEGMNGINSEGNLLYIGAGGKLLSIDTKTKSISVLAANVGYLDGLLKIGKKTFVTSDWGGTVQLIVLGEAPEKLLASKTHAADLGYIPTKHLLLVPTFTENQLVAYKLELNK